MTIPHIAFPFRVTPAGVVDTVEQDTLDEVAQNVRVIVSTVEGERIEVLGFGVPDLVFRNQLPYSVLQAEVEEWEPRASLVFTDTPDHRDELVRLVTITAKLRGVG